MNRISLSVVLWVFLLAGAASAQESTSDTSKVTQSPSGSAGAQQTTLRRSNRMEFDGRLIKGERASGAVYLFQRTPRRLPPLLTLERDQLDQIVLPILRRPADPVPVQTPVGASSTSAADDKDAAKTNTRSKAKKRRAQKRRQDKRRSKRKRRKGKGKSK